MRVVTVSRKPCAAGSTTANVVEYDAAAININACRIGYSSAADLALTKLKNPGRDGELTTSAVYGADRPQQKVTESGRWPPNAILQHRVGCKQTGTTTVPGYTINRWSDGAKPFGGGAGHDYVSEQQPGDEVPVWRCDEGCPVKNLGKQSGETKGTVRKPTGRAVYPTDGNSMVWNPNSVKDTTVRGVDDEGTAARYFKQVQENDMEQIPYELIDYLVTMISPPPSCEPLILVYDELDDVAWEEHEDASVHGLITMGNPEPHMDDIDRVLRPGAHLLVIAPEDEPAGFTAACAIEDFGYEIRDAIALLDAPDDFHYVAKASSSERNAGILMRENATGREVQNDHPCLHPDDLVMTAQGYRPLTEIHEGSLVYAQDGRFHAVEQVSRHRYTSSCLYGVKVLGTNYTTRASDNHPFLIWRPVREKKAIVGGKALWVEAKDVRRGDYTMTPLMADDPSDAPLPPDVAEYRSDDEFWFMFGLYLAEGVAHAGGGDVVYPSYTLGDHEDDLHLRVDAYFSHVTVGIYDKNEGAAVQLIPFDKEAGRLFVELGGKGAANKGLSPVLWSLPTSAREAIFEGYMEGDGGSVRDYRQCKTVSQDLASQMRLLAEGLGYKANMFRYPGRPGKIGNREFKSVRPEHQVRFYSSNQNLEARKPTRPTYVEHEGQRYLLRYIKEVTEIPYEGDVMNLTVEGSPTFMTPVGMTHNTVKAIAVMQALLHDVPEGALVVDPFMGSGTTGIACLRTGHNFLGIDQDENFLRIADQRIRHWDRAKNAWDGATIKSEAKFEESSEPMGLDDLFGI
jgi:intein/homing endonuclease